MTTQHIVHQILLTTSLWTDFLDVSGNGCRGRQEEGRRLESGRRQDSHHNLCASLTIFRCHALISHWHGLVYFLLQSVATLISLSIQGIQPNTQDTPSNFYLANIYQTVSDPNQPNASSSLPTSPPTLPPPNYAIWVNSL